MNFASETLLVTGFPGFHARKLVQYLLTVEPAVSIVLLRRASDSERSAECLARLEPLERARVRELAGDPAALDFGLSGAEYLELAASVQRVYHFASVLEAKRRTGAVTMVLPLYDDDPLEGKTTPYVTYGLIATNMIVASDARGP